MSTLNPSTKTIVERVNTRGRSIGEGVSRWWLAKTETQLYQSVCATVQRIKSRQAGRFLELDRFQALYENEGNSRPGKTGKIPTSWRSGRLSFNVIRSCADTVHAKIGKNRPRVSFVTTDADYMQQEQAKQLDTWMDGVFNHSGIYQEAPRSFLDATWSDGGMLRLFVDDSDDEEVPELKAERILGRQILVDEMEALHGKPKQMHVEWPMAREEVMARYPHKAEEIDRATAIEGGGGYEGDMVSVIESWHLPTKKSAKNGRHTIVVDSAMLVDEPYEKRYFPFLQYCWSEPISGYWGTGLANELLGMQNEINTYLKIIATATRRMGSGRLVIEKGSINTAALTDEPGSVWETTGMTHPPFYMPGVTVSGDVYAHLDRLVRAAYEMTGVSQSAAEAKKPAGVESGVAIREVNDIETGRYAIRAMRYEHMFLQAAEIFLDMARDLAKKGKFVKVKSTASKFLSTISFKDADMEDKMFSMQMWPTGLLPETPEGKFEKATEMMKAGMIDGDTAVSLLDMPDIARVTSLKTASLDDARMVVDSMMAGGEYIEPEPFDNLELCRSVALSSYHRARAKPGYVSEETLQKIRTYMDACTAMIAAKTAPAATGAMAPPGANPEAPPPPIGGPPMGPGGEPLMAPLGVPGAPPVSDMLPPMPMPMGAAA